MGTTKYNPTTVSQEFTLTPGSNVFTVNQGYTLSLIKIFTGTGASGVNTGYSNGSDEIDSAATLTANQTYTITVNKTFDSATNIYISGLAAAATVKLFSNI